MRLLPAAPKVHVHYVPGAIFLVIDLRFTAFGGDLRPAILYGGVERPCHLRPGRVSVDVNDGALQKEFPFRECAHRLRIEVVHDLGKPYFCSTRVDEDHFRRMRPDLTSQVEVKLVHAFGVLCKKNLQGLERLNSI